MAARIFCRDSAGLCKKSKRPDAFGIVSHCPVTYDIVNRPPPKPNITVPTWKCDDFLAAKTIEQLIAEQGISPIADVSIFSGVIPDEDIDEFVADIYRGRAA